MSVDFRSDTHLECESEILIGKVKLLLHLLGNGIAEHTKVILLYIVEHGVACLLVDDVVFHGIAIFLAEQTHRSLAGTESGLGTMFGDLLELLFYFVGIILLFECHGDLTVDVVELGVSYVHLYLSVIIIISSLFRRGMPLYCNK